jgi:hypothetical protein
MKKRYLILTALTVLALAAMSCGIQFVGATSTPTPAPQGLIPQNFDPGLQNGNPGGPSGPDNGNPGQGPNSLNPGQPEPQNGNPVPQGPGPNPNGGNPGQGEIQLFTADRMSLNKGECTNLHWQTQGGFQANINGQPVPAAGQQQVCPMQTTLYGLGLDIGSQILRQEITVTVSGGSQGPAPIATTPAKKNKPDGPTITPTQKGFLVDPNIQIAVLDLGISNIYPSSTGHIMVTLKNTGNIKISGSYKVSCSGSYVDSGGNNALKLAGQYASVDLKPGATKDFDTSYSRNPKILEMTVSCTLTPPEGDTNQGNNTLVKKVK